MSESTLRLSVVIPIYNERDNLHPLTAQTLKALSGQVPSFEIIYVDDGSTDGSAQLLDQLARNHAEVRVFHFDRNYGQTAAFDAGFQQARGELVATLERLALRGAQTLAASPELSICCGWRRDRQDTIVKRLSSRIANFVRNAAIHDGVHDTGCSLKVFQRHVIERLPLFKGMHRFFPALAKIHGFSMTEVPVSHYNRAHGQSKYGIGNRLFSSLYDLIAVRWMQARCLRYIYRKDQHDLQ